MINELKTLKDFDWGNVIRCNDCNFSSDELRQEAINWIKSIRSDISDYFDDPKRDTKMEYSKRMILLQGEEIAFMRFFNLSEEDLK